MDARSAASIKGFRLFVILNLMGIPGLPGRTKLKLAVPSVRWANNGRAVGDRLGFPNVSSYRATVPPYISR